MYVGEEHQTPCYRLVLLISCCSCGLLTARLIQAVAGLTSSDKPPSGTDQTTPWSLLGLKSGYTLARTPGPFHTQPGPM
ncbi:hypothetical protein RRG08_051678 [Elysia crispata]|uniref:Uncharacterized protein n=1 Tax=Elysia crispata TaxID=231223 RepID=A0AAE1AGK9_9GAST|nr:hypothetical protein RRG08_051678 [Elysia crispata]